MNLGKPLSVSESESDKYLLDFLKEEAMIGVYFSLVQCSTTHRGVQLVGISQCGNPFALAETGIHYQYTCIKYRNSESLLISGFSGQNSTLNTIDPQPRLLAPIK